MIGFVLRPALRRPDRLQASVSCKQVAIEADPGETFSVKRFLSGKSPLKFCTSPGSVLIGVRSGKIGIELALLGRGLFRRIAKS